MNFLKSKFIFIGYFDGQDGSCDGEYSDEETETPYWAEYEELENCGNWCDE